LGVDETFREVKVDGKSLLESVGVEELGGG
jgi:hypothetical protein